MLSKVLCFIHNIDIKIEEPWSNGQLSCFLGLEVFCWLEPHVPLIGVSSQTSEIIKRSCKSFCLTVYANKAQSAQLPVIEMSDSLRNKTRILRIKITIILRFKDFCWVYQQRIISCTMHTTSMTSCTQYCLVPPLAASPNHHPSVKICSNMAPGKTL